MLMFYIQKWAIHQFRTWPSWLNDRSGFVVWPKIHVNWSFRLSTVSGRSADSLQWSQGVLNFAYILSSRYVRPVESTVYILSFFFKVSKNCLGTIKVSIIENDSMHRILVTFSKTLVVPWNEIPKETFEREFNFMIWKNLSNFFNLKFRFSEKAKKKWKIGQTFLAFSEYLKFEIMFFSQYCFWPHQNKY